MNKKVRMKHYTNILIISILVHGLLSCAAKKAVYIYGTPEFESKQKELNYSLGEAAVHCQDYIAAREQLDSVRFIRLDLIYGDDYIFQIRPMHYNLKTTEYWLSGIWVNGKDGVVKEVKSRKPIQVYLDPVKHKPFFYLLNTEKRDN